MNTQILRETQADEAFAKMLSGETVAVICKAHFDAVAKCRNMMHRHRDTDGFHLASTQTSIKHVHSGGLLEFVWIASASGRRSDDFRNHALASN